MAEGDVIKPLLFISFVVDDINNERLQCPQPGSPPVHAVLDRGDNSTSYIHSLHHGKHENKRTPIFSAQLYKCIACCRVRCVPSAIFVSHPRSLRGVELCPEVEFDFKVTVSLHPHTYLGTLHLGCNA